MSVVVDESSSCGVEDSFGEVVPVFIGWGSGLCLVLDVSECSMVELTFDDSSLRCSCMKLLLDRLLRCGTCMGESGLAQIRSTVCNASAHTKECRRLTCSYGHRLFPRIRRTLCQ